MAEGKLNFPMDKSAERGVYGALSKMLVSLRAKEALARTIAAGDLTRDVALTSEADILGHALQQMTDGLRGMVSSISSTGAEQKKDSDELSSASKSLSQGCVDQASSLEEISSALSEFGA